MTIEEVIAERGPITVAAFMDLALYDPQFGYYARAARRSGRAGDFVTSVDVGPLFGEILACQIAEMARLLDSPFPGLNSFDLVEAGAGNGRLSADILLALHSVDPDVYARTRLHLVETSEAARAAHGRTLAPFLDRVASSSDRVPEFEGVLVANELLDAMPVHQVVMRDNGLREIYVDADPKRRSGGLRIVEGPPSTAALMDYLTRLGVTLGPGWRAEINLRATAWVGEAARRLRRGFLILFDYGHPASELYSVTHSAGTLTAYSRHRSAGPESPGPRPPWLLDPGEQDLTAHVDFTSVRFAAEQAGCATLAFMDQTYFAIGVLGRRGSMERLTPKERRALKTLIMPGGLGSTMKALVLGKGVGLPSLACCSAGARAT
ncbi:MAG: SAM-dependent methyltransferase [Luteitalea sp.]|nr:SAM-dependent methyltransferase [Luteitalea sp.]